MQKRVKNAQESAFRIDGERFVMNAAKAGASGVQQTAP